MSLQQAIGILLISAIYIFVFIITIKNKNRNSDTKILMDASKHNKIKTFVFEQKIIDSLHLNAKKIKFFIYIERIFIFGGLASVLILARGLALVFIGSGFAVFFFEDLYKKLLYNSGINNIVKVNNFINYFVPHINSGNSADQSFLGYVQYAKDEDLAEFYENKDNQEYKNSLKPHIKQIVDIYSVAKYNEDKGINNYSYILNEISQDYSQKQKYYNRFLSSMGEVQPTVYCYYIGVPILIMIGYNQASEVWMGMYGWIISIVLLALFLIFKFLIYKLQKKIINIIF